VPFVLVGGDGGVFLGSHPPTLNPGMAGAGRDQWSPRRGWAGSEDLQGWRAHPSRTLTTLMVETCLLVFRFHLTRVNLCPWAPALAGAGSLHILCPALGFLPGSETPPRPPADPPGARRAWWEPQSCRAPGLAARLGSWAGAGSVGTRSLPGAGRVCATGKLRQVGMADRVGGLGCSGWALLQALHSGSSHWSAGSDRDSADGAGGPPRCLCLLGPRADAAPRSLGLLPQPPSPSRSPRLELTCSICQR